MNNLNPLSQMTDESLKAFISKVQADTSPQERLNVEGTAPIALASAAGIVINTEDLNTYLQNLSDVELKGVAGMLWYAQTPACTGTFAISWAAAPMPGCRIYRSCLRAPQPTH